MKLSATATTRGARRSVNGSGNVAAMLRDAISAVEKRFPKLVRKPAKPRESASPAPARPGSVRIHEAGFFRVLEAMPDGPNGEKIFKVILLSEGPGNRRNRNFYGPEAIASAVKAFEGRWCYLNHQDEDEAETLPERRVQDKGGYYKNLGTMQVKEGSACAGELHCDLTETGVMLAGKIKSALKYKESFPDNGLEYVGFSINGDGDAETRDMTDQGGGPADNYVTAITEGDSCDLVTTPARGGRGLSVIREDEAGAVTPTSQEDRMKKKLQAIFAKFAEAVKGLGDEEKKKLAESQKALAALVKEAEGETEGADAFEAMCAKREGESDEDHLKRLHGMAKAVATHLGKVTDTEATPEPAATPAKATPVPDADAQESRRDALAGLIKESGLPEGAYSKEEIVSLQTLPYREAKAIIAKDAKLAESIRKSVSAPVASLHRGGISESSSSTTAAFIAAAQEE